MDKAKPFDVSKQEVWEAYKRVKANGGAAGVDEQSIEEFDKDLVNNLYKLWNRLSSGSYFPPAVRRVEIPKGDGRMRPLGIPTVADRIAQMVVKRRLEEKVEPLFHPDSYGYRPNKSALDALEKARARCWRLDWALDLDIKSFFDSLDHALLMRAVRRHANNRWVELYVERWLRAPVQLPAGQLMKPEKGTPQGGVVSPVLANLFLHYAFDLWMVRHCSFIPFERYADDVVCHCSSKTQAEWLREALEVRFAQCGLELHPSKTRVVYCKDSNRRGSHTHESFDFLGYTFRPRRSRNRDGRYFVSFSPAVSKRAAKAIRQTVRRWRLHKRVDKDLDDLARIFNPYIRGWINYYGYYCPSALYPTLRHLNLYLARWGRGKYRRFKGSRRRARHWLASIASRQPHLFAHWSLVGP